MSDKTLELKIVVRTVDEASKVIRQIKQEAARQVSGRGGVGGKSDESLRQATARTRREIAFQERMLKQKYSEEKQYRRELVWTMKAEEAIKRETIKLDKRMVELGIKGYENASNADKKAAIAFEEAHQRRVKLRAEEYKLNSLLDEYGLGHLKDRTIAEKKAALTVAEANLRRNLVSKKSFELDKQAAELGIKWRENLTNAEKRLEIAAHNRREAMRRASEQLLRFRLMDVAMGLRTISTEALVLGSSMLGVGVAVARASLQMNTAIVRFQKTAEAIIGSKEAAQQLVSDLTSFVIRSPFKTQEATESARKLIQVVGVDAVRYLEDLANLTAGSGGDQATLDRIITTFVQSYKDPRLMGYTTRSLTRNMVQYLALIRKGLEEEGKKLTEEQVSALINSSMSGKRFWELLLKGSKATFGPDIMKHLGEKDPLFQWEMTIDHLLMKLHQLTGPFREWLLAVLKGVNSILDKFDNAPGGLGAVLFSLGITASIVFGGMLVALSGILFMANLVVLSIIGIRSAMNTLGVSTLGELIAAGKAWVGGALSAGKAGAGGARAAGKALAGGVIGAAGWTKGPGVFKRVAAWWRGVKLAFYKDFILGPQIKDLERTGLMPSRRLRRRYGAVGRLGRASAATAFAPISTFSKLLSMLGVLITIVKYWDKMDESAKLVLKTVGAIYAVLKLMRVAVWLLEKRMLGMVARNIAIFTALELANRNWGKIEDAIMTGEGKDRRLRPAVQWAAVIGALVLFVPWLIKQVKEIAKIGKEIAEIGKWIAGIGKGIAKFGKGIAKFGKAIVGSYGWLVKLGGGSGAIAGLRFLIQSAIASLLGSPGWIAAIVVAVVAALGYLIYRWVKNRERPTPRWMGGRFRAGEALLVGERGPEVVRFDRGGSVIPNHALRAKRPKWRPSSESTAQFVLARLLASPAAIASIASIVVAGIAALGRRLYRKATTIGWPKLHWRSLLAAPAVTAGRPHWWTLPVAPSVTAARQHGRPSPAAPAVTAERPQLRPSSALTALTNVALSALRAPLPSVRNPSVTTFFPWPSVPGYMKATRAIGPHGVTDFFEIEEEGGDVVIRVHNPYGALRRAGEGLMFR